MQAPKVCAGSQEKIALAQGRARAPFASLPSIGQTVLLQIVHSLCMLVPRVRTDRSVLVYAARTPYIRMSPSFISVGRLEQFGSLAFGRS